jgi:hypothetical protein
VCDNNTVSANSREELENNSRKSRDLTKKNSHSDSLKVSQGLVKKGVNVAIDDDDDDDE